jgi:hypothetical protein
MQAMTGPLDPDLKGRIHKAMERLNRAMTEAERNPTLQNLDELREACDELMRSTARVLLELARSD